MLSNDTKSELSSLEGTRGEFNPRKRAIKLGIDVHQEFYVVVLQESGTNPKPAQRFTKAELPELGGEAAAKAWRSHPRGL